MKMIDVIDDLYSIHRFIIQDVQHTKVLLYNIQLRQKMATN